MADVRQADRCAVDGMFMCECCSGADIAGVVCGIAEYFARVRLDRVAGVSLSAGLLASIVRSPRAGAARLVWTLLGRAARRTCDSVINGTPRQT